MKLFDNPIAKLLLKQIRDEKLEPKEKEELEAWIASSEENKEFAEQFKSEAYVKQRLDQVDAYNIDRAVKKFWERYEPQQKAKVVRLYWKWQYVAATVAFLLVISTVLYFYYGRNKENTALAQSENTQLKNDKAPGKDGAVLKLADGREIVLDSAGNGDIATQGNTKVRKQGAVLLYDADKGNVEVALNTLSTSRGRQFQVALPDGSKVWLNSASSITFPTTFIGKQRKVEITGEAYFEVAKNEKMPFIVSAKGMEVKVLGTHFNINAYNDEDRIKTTLLEGAVNVSLPAGGGPGVRLKPGQQAQVGSDFSKTLAIVVADDVDVEATTAWKNGLIIFNRASVQEIMRQISRWYDVDIEYKTPVSVPKLYGKIPRTVNLSEVLKSIEITSNLKFFISGNVVTVEQP